MVSVIIPSYNHELFIEEAVESVFEQSYLNIELIVLDDGSVDSSLKKLEELHKKSPIPFTLISKNNEGLSVTLNQGLKLAKGEFISILASDDIFQPEKLSSQVNYLQRFPNMGFCHARVFRLEDGVLRESINSNTLEGNIFDSLLLGNTISSVSTLVRRDAYEVVGGFDEDSYIEDWDMWLRISRKFEVGFLDEVVATYRIHNSNISGNFEKMHEAKLRIIKKWSGISAYRNAKLMLFKSYFIFLLKKKKFRKAVYFLLFNPLIIFKISFRNIIIR